MKTKILSWIVLTVMCFFSQIGVYAQNNTDTSPLKPRDKVESQNLPSNNKTEEKSEGKKVFTKFLISMFWVAGSCIAIFLILLAYKKLKGTKLGQTKHIDISKNLNSPDTVDEAIKFFIEKF